MLGLELTYITKLLNFAARIVAASFAEDHVPNHHLGVRRVDIWEGGLLRAARLIDLGVTVIAFNPDSQFGPMHWMLATASRTVLDPFFVDQGLDLLEVGNSLLVPLLACEPSLFGWALPFYWRWFVDVS